MIIRNLSRCGSECGSSRSKSVNKGITSARIISTVISTNGTNNNNNSGIYGNNCGFLSLLSPHITHAPRSASQYVYRSRSFSTTLRKLNNTSSSAGPISLEFNSSSGFVSNSPDILSGGSKLSNTPSQTKVDEILLRASSNWKSIDWNSITDILHDLRIEKSFNNVLEIGNLILNDMVFESTSIVNLPLPPVKFFDELLLTIYDSASITYNTTPTRTNPSKRITKVVSTSPDHANLAGLILDQMISLKHEISFYNLSIFYQLIVPLGDAFFAKKYMLISQNVSITTTAQRKRYMTHIILLHISCGNIEGALHSLREMAEANAGKLTLPRGLYEVLLLSTLHQDDMEYSRQVMEYLHSSGPVYARTWGIFISHACRLMDYENVEWAWKTAAIPGRIVLNDYCYQQMVEIGRANGDFTLTRWALLREQRRKQALSKPDNTNRITQFAALIEAYARNEDIGSCLKFMRRLGDRGSSILRLRDVPLLLQVVASDRELLFKTSNHVKQLLTKAKGPLIPPSVKILYVNIILSAYVTARIDPKTILDYYSNALFDFNVSYNEDTMICLLQLAQSTGDVFLARQIIHFDCEAFGITRTRRMFELAINLSRDLGAHDMADEYLQLMKASGIRPKAYLLEHHLVSS